MAIEDDIVSDLMSGLLDGASITIGGVAGFVPLLTVIGHLKMGDRPSKRQYGGYKGRLKGDPRIEVRFHLGKTYIRLRSGGGRSGISIDF